MEADKPAAVAALHCMHECFDVTRYDIDGMQADKGVCVLINSSAEIESIWLPPCAPRQSKVNDKSDLFTQ